MLAWAGPFAPLRARAQPAGPAFAVQSIASAGRSVAAEFGDFDGDGRAELLTVVVEGMAPDEKRTLHVHAAQPEGGLAPTPTWSAPLPPGVATYDVADLDGAPGLEVLLLDRAGIRVLAGAGADASWRRILVPAPPTIAVRPDER
ncbi:MAG: VCBS repeat-containing protein, partial [Myxococcota bacterium]|nr:VCBS repeat-containing protein [Myxococcota bacterium]